MRKTDLLFITMLLTIAFAIATATVQANETTIACVSLVEDPVSIGQIFTVNITVTNVIGVCAWEMKLGFDQTKLNCTDVWCPPDNIFAGKMNVVPKGIDNTAGFVHYGFVFFPVEPEDAFNGIGLLCQVEFNATAVGDVSLTFLGTGPEGDTYLLDYDEAEITYTPVNCSVTVIPEFLPSFLLVLLMSLTLFSVILATKLQKPKSINKNK